MTVENAVGAQMAVDSLNEAAALLANGEGSAFSDLKSYVQEINLGLFLHQ